jgi:putative tryptophan/tyrosine transport system substrate-binding protein
MKRRMVLSLLGGAAVSWPRAGWAQQAVRPVVGFLNPGSRGDFEHHAEAFLKGLKESGFTEGENITVEYRWAEGRYERLPQLAAELVKLRVAVIGVGSPPATIAVKSATSTIPIVFITADDPVKDGFVTSFNRPGGNLTGVTVFTTAAMWNKPLPSWSIRGMLQTPIQPR